MSTSRARFLAVVALLACKPSKKDIDEINAKLDAIALQQEDLSRRVAAAEGRKGSWEADAQLTRLEDGLYELSGQITEALDRLEDVEGKVDQRPSPPRVRAGRPDPNDRFNVTIGRSHVKGPPTALVTVVMWTDYQCPFSARVQTTLREVEKKYGQDVRFVHKHNPLPMHNRAMPAALAAEAAGNQSKFWPMHDALFEAGTQNLSDETFEELAQKLGLNVRRFKRDLQDPGLSKQIKEEQSQGSILGARGTPAFFINGRFLSGAQPLEAFERVIDAELAHARKLVRNGTPRKRIYERVSRDGKAKPD